MRANFTRPGAFSKEGDASAPGGSPMRSMRPGETPPPEHVLRNIGLEAAPPPPLFDTGLGQSFFQMRTKLAVSLWNMARLIDTEPTVIANLEAGALDSLPAWTELTRIVEAYGALTGTDTGPLLARLIKDYAMTGPAVTQPITAHLPPLAPPAPVQTVSHGPAAPRRHDAVAEIIPYDDAVQTETRPAMPSGRPTAPSRPMARMDRSGPIEDVEDDVDGDAEPDQRQALRRSHVPVWLILGFLVVAVATVLAARMQPRVLYAAAWPFPQAVRQPVVAGIDWLVVAIAPRRDGLVWIDAGDPAWRKTDKLPEHKP